jgi:hypothetical protein
LRIRKVIIAPKPLTAPRKPGFFSRLPSMSRMSQVVRATAVARLVLMTAAAATKPETPAARWIT